MRNGRLRANEPKSTILPNLFYRHCNRSHSRTAEYWIMQTAIIIIVSLVVYLLLGVGFRVLVMDFFEVSLVAAVRGNDERNKVYCSQKLVEHRENPLTLVLTWPLGLVIYAVKS